MFQPPRLPRTYGPTIAVCQVSLRLRLLAVPFDEAGGLRVCALTHEGGDRDLVALYLVNIPDDDPVDAGTLDIADLQLGFDDRDVAGHVFADDLPTVLGRHAALQLFPNCVFADTRGPAQAAVLHDRVIAVQGQRAGHIAAG